MDILKRIAGFFVSLIGCIVALGVLAMVVVILAVAGPILIVIIWVIVAVAIVFDLEVSNDND